MSSRFNAYSKTTPSSTSKSHDTILAKKRKAERRARRARRKREKELIKQAELEKKQAELDEIEANMKEEDKVAREEAIQSQIMETLYVDLLASSKLDFSDRQLEEIPELLYEIEMLKEPLITDTDIQHKNPNDMFSIPFRELHLQCNKLTKIPRELCKSFDFVRELYLFNNKLESLPRHFGLLNHLEILVVSHNKITSIHPDLVKLTDLKVVDLSYNKLTELPSLFRNFVFLEELLVSNNELTTLPKLPGLQRLQVLDLDNNNITELPVDSVGVMEDLHSLSLMNNQLNFLPSDIVKCVNLRCLETAGNPLICPPAKFAARNTPPKILSYMEYYADKDIKQLIQDCVDDDNDFSPFDWEPNSCVIL